MSIRKDGKIIAGAYVPATFTGGEGINVSSGNVISNNQATASSIGGIKASPKTISDTQEIKIDTTTGKLYTLPSGGAIDGSTITFNTDSQLQTIGVKDNKTSTTNLFWTGTKAEYDAIVTKDSNTFYNVTDESISGTENVADIGLTNITTSAKNIIAVQGFLGRNSGINLTVPASNSTITPAYDGWLNFVTQNLSSGTLYSELKYQSPSGAWIQTIGTLNVASYYSAIILPVMKNVPVTVSYSNANAKSLKFFKLEGAS